MPVSNDDGSSRIAIPLTSTQIKLVVQAADERGLSGILAMLRDHTLSDALLRGLALFACFELDGADRAVSDLARKLDTSPSTAHRYASTLVSVGLLEHAPTTRKYSLARRLYVALDG
jgi:DNA-binding MarR family transcriptional regulator